jgi:transcription-repair coupling factor (superfamily II helicase)
MRAKLTTTRAIMIPQSLVHSSVIKGTFEKVSWGNLPEGAQSLALYSYATAAESPVVIFTKNNHSADLLKEELDFYSNKQLRIFSLPDWEVLPFDRFSPHEDITSQRLSTLYQLQDISEGVVIVSITSALSYLLPTDQLRGQCLYLNVGDTLDIPSWQKQLQIVGYHRVDEVMSHGEYTLRGSIVDIYPMGSKTPYRIDCFDNEVDSIRVFDPETQRSTHKTDQIRLLPAHEYPLTDDSISFFRQQWRATFSSNAQSCPVYQSVSQGESAAGLEFYLPLFYENMATVFDYLPKNSSIFIPEDFDAQLTQFTHDVDSRYEQLRYDPERPILEPKHLYLRHDALYHHLKAFNRIMLTQALLPEGLGTTNFSTKRLPQLDIQHRLANPLTALENFILNFTGKILICAESEGRQEVLLDLLKPLNQSIKRLDTWQDQALEQAPLQIITAPIIAGFIDTQLNLALITETDLFGEHVAARKQKTSVQDPNLIIRSLTELKPGEPVVHISHGIGLYQGLKHIKTGDVESEYMLIQYADTDKVYVPIDRLEVISRYVGRDAEHAPINKLGSKQWDKQKERALKRVRDVAAELLVIYSKREATPGFSFNAPNNEFRQFKAAFPFEETPDQQAAIQSVIGDMTRARPMDRLICGDVGFGKTEVAMQAAALALQSGKQVAMLVPTTLLATQHAENFQNRFANWPIKISSFSRFVGVKDQKTILENLKSGQCDIIIGTHKLLSDDVKFNDLGLLIIDEEHRFGVRHKEKIKAMRAHVDILTLTATPIPRTLNMAFAGMRDLSIIATPPAKRLSVKTFVRENSDPLIKEALLRESMRGGQVYYLHNNIETIHATAANIQKLMPDARIAIGHGQMPKRQLESVMMDFYHQRVNVLVCTTIIESGIDVPTANTIIIDQANKFGLAQLHQLRGRVGRSHHQAYAYLLVPSLKGLNSDAQKRLDAISELSSLGAGFNLANHDLEIRGAGALLGEEQSGNMEAIGFSLYMEMLEEAVNALKNGVEFTGLSDKIELEIDCHISALITEFMIPDINTRLTLYKRLADCLSVDDINELQAEMIDRFGKLPEPTQNLIGVAKLRLRAKAMRITKIEINAQYGHIYFDEKPNIKFEALINLIQKQAQQYQLLGASTLRFNSASVKPEERLTRMNTVLDKIK